MFTLNRASINWRGSPLEVGLSLDTKTVNRDSEYTECQEHHGRR
jgi:hypothetical protein